MKYLLKKIIPKFVWQFYHLSLAYLATLYYKFPSNRLIVVGVTGTAGKSTTVNLIARVLESAGYKVGLSSTLNFKIGKKEWINQTKMTMLGRFALQRLLRKMVKEDCQYAVIETSSEGIKQFRHLGINYDVLVFTNLTPEHIESHGSFEKYRQAKLKLFQRLMKMRRKKIKGKVIKKGIIVNLDDENAPYFLKYPADFVWGFSLDREKAEKFSSLSFLCPENLKFVYGKPQFSLFGENFNLNLPGKFNLYNCLAAICLGLSQDISLEKIRDALEKIDHLPGRLEKINLGQPFEIVVDYAHTPESLKQVYQLLRPLVKGKMIAVLGSCGGGRDKAKRPKLGALAAQYADIVIITNEDPYDEDPWEIIHQVAKGAQLIGKEVFKILDRKEALEKAIALAKDNDLIIVTGKGSEQWIVGPRGKKIPWDDRMVIKEILEKRKNILDKN